MPSRDKQSFFFFLFPETDGSQIGMGALSGRHSALPSASTPTQCFTLLIVQRVNSMLSEEDIKYRRRRRVENFQNV